MANSGSESPSTTWSAARLIWSVFVSTFATTPPKQGSCVIAADYALRRSCVPARHFVTSGDARPTKRRLPSWEFFDCVVCRPGLLGAFSLANVRWLLEGRSVVADLPSPLFVGRASPHDILRRAGTLVLRRGTSHLGSSSIALSAAQVFWSVFIGKSTTTPRRQVGCGRSAEYALRRSCVPARHFVTSGDARPTKRRLPSWEFFDCVCRPGFLGRFRWEIHDDSSKAGRLWRICRVRSS